MHYEHSALNEITAKSEELSNLLDTARAEFSEEKAKELLRGSFRELESTQREQITAANSRAHAELRAQIQSEIEAKTRELFGENRSVLLQLVLRELNLESLSETITRSFLEQNKENFKAFVQEVLEAEDLTGFCEESRQILREKLAQFQSEMEAKTNALNDSLRDLELSCEKAVAARADSALKSYIAENSTEVFRPFSLRFLKDSFLQDNIFRSQVRAESKRATREILQSHHIESVSEALLDINASLAHDFFNSFFIKEQAFLQSLTLSAMNLNSQLRRISETIANIVTFEQGENLAAKKVFKVV